MRPLADLDRLLITLPAKEAQKLSRENEIVTTRTALRFAFSTRSISQSGE